MKKKILYIIIGLTPLIPLTFLIINLFKINNETYKFKSKHVHLITYIDDNRYYIHTNISISKNNNVIYNYTTYFTNNLNEITIDTLDSFEYETKYKKMFYRYNSSKNWKESDYTKTLYDVYLDTINNVKSVNNKNIELKSKKFIIKQLNKYLIDNNILEKEIKNVDVKYLDDVYTIQYIIDNKIVIDLSISYSNEIGGDIPNMIKDCFNFSD